MWKRLLLSVAPSLTVFASFSRSPTHTGSPQGVVTRSPPIYQLSAAKRLIQRMLFFVSYTMYAFKGVEKMHKNSHL